MQSKLTTQVDFAYSFGTPHRLCICTPEASKKSLLDASVSGLTMSWTDRDLSTNPLGAFKSPGVDYIADFTAENNGSVMQGKRWRRVENWIPAMEYIWEIDAVTITVTAVAVMDAMVLKLRAANSSSNSVKAGVYGKTRKMCVNTAWVDSNSPYNALLAHTGDQSDRIIYLAAGAPKGTLRNWSNIDAEWILPGGAEETAYIVRPYFAIIDQVEEWLARDWEQEIGEGLAIWRRLLAKAPQFTLPDQGVTDAYYATLADIFVMRELQADGRIAGAAGTDMYRAANSGEPCFQSMALNRAGFYAESREGIDFVAQFQEDDGCWEDVRRWGHHMWGTSGTKSWSIREHYKFTGDREYLSRNFERMLASSRWSQLQRTSTKLPHEAGEKPLTWGLMPRGLGDCGLMDENGDLFGVFYPHNFWHCLGLEIAVWAAEELGRTDVIDELRSNYKDLHQCLLDSLEFGAITEPDGSKWIPGMPGKTSGSRWGVADAITPCRIIPADHPLANGTMAKLESDMSEGGLPKNLGWLKDSLWVAIALDTISYAHLLRDEADQVADYMYAALNHGTPLMSWSEERLPDKGSKVIEGDLQHAWTPVALARLIRDCLLMEDEGILHIGMALPRWWLEAGHEIKVEHAPTHWGDVDYNLTRSVNKLLLNLRFAEGSKLPVDVLVHIRTPEAHQLALAHSDGGEAAVIDGKVAINVLSHDVYLEIDFK